MTSNQLEKRGIIAKFAKKCIEIFLRKECTKIGKLKIDVNASTIEIIKGFIKKVYLYAEGIKYKNLLFDTIEVEAKDINVSFKIINKEIKFGNNFLIYFKITLSENSLKAILISNSWNWVSNMIRKEISNLKSLEDIIIKNNQLIIKGKKESLDIHESERIDIKAEGGKIFLENKQYSKSILIPIEEKIYINNLFIKNNLITLYANSNVSFN